MSSSPENNFFDFTHEVKNDMTIFPRPWHRKTNFTSLGTLETVGRRTSQISIGTHSGTHIDAPSHFIKDGKSIDEIPVSQFIGQAYMFDFTKYNPELELSVQEISKRVSEVDYSFSGKAIFFNFGFGPYFNTPEYYYAKQPWISQDAAEYLASLKPSLIGYDLAMLDNPTQGYGCDSDSPIHKIFLSQSIPLVENALFPRNLSGFISYSVTPLRLKKLDGSPVRFVGWVDGLAR